MQCRLAAGAAERSRMGCRKTRGKLRKLEEFYCQALGVGAYGDHG